MVPKVSDRLELLHALAKLRGEVRFRRGQSGLWTAGALRLSVDALHKSNGDVDHLVTLMTDDCLPEYAQNIKFELFKIDANTNGSHRDLSAVPVDAGATNRLGQLIFKGLKEGEYELSCSSAAAGVAAPEEITSGESWIDRIRKRLVQSRVAASIALAALLLLGAGATYVVSLQQKLDNAISAREAYERALAELRLEEVITPTVRVLDEGARKNRVRVGISPRVAEGLIRDVKIRWEPEGSWESMWGSDKTAPKAFELVHTYTLKAEKAQRQLEVAYTVTDGVSKARNLTPDDLTARFLIESADEAIVAAKPLTGSTRGGTGAIVSQNVKVEMLKPVNGDPMGWSGSVSLSASEDTERITLVVRPQAENRFYVQPGSMPLRGGQVEAFPVKLGDGRGIRIGDKFEIVAFASNSFIPERDTLTVDQLPTTTKVAEAVVVKVAGTAAVAKANEGTEISGEIWTDAGAMVVAAANGSYRVVKIIPPSPVGGSFSFSVSGNDSGRLLLVVNAISSPAPKEGATLQQLPENAWTYDIKHP